MPHVAQLNVARRKVALTDPVWQEFVDLLAPVNAIADASEGFVWRLQGDDGDATDFHLFGDERLVVNLSVWESVPRLRAFLGAPEHVAVYRRRRTWFEERDAAHVVLWWVPEGRAPTLEEAGARLQHLRAHGPSPHAFDPAHLFDPDEASTGA